jgi:hypothetical protein
MSWGIYDDEDELWYGGDEGPKLFDDLLLARCALTVLHAQLPKALTMRSRWKEGPRLQVKEWPGGPARVRDEVKTRMSPEEALKRIERGTIV